MSECQHYREYVVQLKSKETGMGRAPANVYRRVRPWCAHAKSPVTLQSVQTVLNGHSLTCQGDIGNCPISGN